MCKVVDIRCVLTSSTVMTSGFTEIEDQRTARKQGHRVLCIYTHLRIPMKCARSVTNKHVRFWLTGALETSQDSSAEKCVADSSFVADTNLSMDLSCTIVGHLSSGNSISSIANKIPVVIRYSAVKE